MAVGTTAAYRDFATASHTFRPPKLRKGAELQDFTTAMSIQKDTSSDESLQGKVQTAKRLQAYQCLKLVLAESEGNTKYQMVALNHV